ncbi:FkbM family methyltransferase [Novipirellula artificiosorum]|uniref:Methyltransferase FkbM domain-containing protein n=1 Tax=Novipirellula artificiosorum TaxID=2528016 RepID=A0A5C6DH96_9BACT|nr:FkbM family methyltransferase [Novipirellula artificiosorum]TWU34416.1 hypothetical protein Poly41_45640 [Novipirellula artificiosorum]
MDMNEEQKVGTIRRWVGAFRKPLAGQRNAFAQEGEDLVLESFLFRQATGYYVDVGAHHPTQYSNTYFFYLKGWRGINIDAAPTAMEAFKRLRPRDTNLTAAVGRPGEERDMVIFAEGAVTTLSPEFANRVSQEMGCETLGTQKVNPQSLASILDQHLPDNQAISFLTVDVEGLDLEVLQSNDWTRYRPTLVLAEHHGASLDNTTIQEAIESPVAAYLGEQEYELVAKTARTIFFRDRLGIS